jgi:serine/threonine-protein kinase
MKKLVLVISMILLVTTLCSCGQEMIVVPDVSLTDSDTAKTVISNKGLIPVIMEEYNDEVDSGVVIRTEPENGTEVDESEKIVIYVSKGPQMKMPNVKNMEEEAAVEKLKDLGITTSVKYVFSDDVDEGLVIDTNLKVGEIIDEDTSVSLTVSKGSQYIYSKDSTITWHNYGDNQDNWEFEGPYIDCDENMLIINCEPTFGTSVELKESNSSSGLAFANASLNDTFNKTVPAEVDCDSLIMYSGTTYTMVLKIPLSELDTEKPTDIYLEIYTPADKPNINISFSMTW